MSPVNGKPAKNALNMVYAGDVGAPANGEHVELKPTSRAIRKLTGKANKDAPPIDQAINANGVVVDDGGRRC